MSIQQYTSAFASQSASFGGVAVRRNLDDYVSLSGNSPSWSSGAQQLDQVQLTPPASVIWTLLGITITADIGLTNATPAYGKLGKILAGLVLGQAPGPQQAALTFPLPSNQGAIGDLWDPASDPLPPSNPTTTAPPPMPLLPVSVQINLPQPVPIYQGEMICAGLFMLPSLLGASSITGLAVVDGGYTITYDDGLTPPNYA